ncbi:MAG: hypothetical protein KIT22_15050, partial [Verrucomicrobiae bacterium]|nr:hypothetical protein [Verrucomicrobiae bacterium]
SWWTNDWHFFVFSKKADVKQVWIDGQYFFEGIGTTPLPTDLSELFIGSNSDGGGLLHGLVDDFSIFSTALTQQQIEQLFSGTAPTALPAGAGLIAYWDFNDTPSIGQFARVSPSPDAATAAPDLIEIVHIDGATAWTEANVSLRVNGIQVTPTFTRDGATVTLRYVPATLFAAQTTYTASLTYPGEGGTPATTEWQFTVGPYTRDVIASRLGTLWGGATFTPGGGGRTGQAGDFALDLPAAPAGAVSVADGSFLNPAAADDTLTVSFWQKVRVVRNASAFWFNSPSSPESTRGFQAHVPWSNQNIYFDSTGCCATDETRINLGVNEDTVPGYTDVTWWYEWRHYAFVKRAEVKEVWIDGVLFLSGFGIPLPTDFTNLVLGGGPNAGGNPAAGLLDDFAIFDTALTEAQIQALASGTAPNAVAGSPGLIALWDFNDVPAEGLFINFVPSPGSATAVPNQVQVTHLQGSAAWDTNRVTLTIDGSPVAATVGIEGGILTVNYVPDPIFAPSSTHTAVLSYPGAGGQSATREWSFTVGSYTLDTVKGYLGLLTGPAQFTADGGGHSGQPGDYAIDLGTVNARQSVHILDASFINDSTRVADALSVAGWQKLHQISDSAFFWGNSPSSSGSSRGFSAHSPWSNNSLYFDTVGCCDAATQRINGSITDFPGYSGEVTWWEDWHHLVFLKQGEIKQIWIDGQLFLEGSNTSPLPTDFTEAWIGFDPPDNATLRGVVDDVAIFGTGLTQEQITTLASGTLPSALPASAGLLAYWNFNDPPPDVGPTPVLSITRDGDNIRVTSVPQPLPSSFVVQTAPALSGPWTPQAALTPPFTLAIGDAEVFVRVVSP